MKRFVMLFLSVWWIGGAHLALADFSDFDFKTEPKCQEKNTTTSNDQLKQDEHWTYEVSASNKSARDYADVEVRYILFKKEAIARSKTGATKIVRTTGSFKAPAVKAHGDFTFTTVPVELKKSQLVGGYTYTSGAPARTYDSLAGIWIRVFVGAKQVAEYTAPQGLQNKEKWDAPGK